MAMPDSQSLKGLILMIPVGFPAVKVTYLEKPQLKIISFKNYKH